MKPSDIIAIAKGLKIKALNDDESLSWEERFKRLEEHHKDETQSLYEKIYELENHLKPEIKITEQELMVGALGNLSKDFNNLTKELKKELGQIMAEGKKKQK
jgi:hypothetical protein